MACTATIVIRDEVNVRIKGIDPGTIEDCQKALTFHVPGYVHMPAYKLGRWDGTIKLFTQTGSTYLELLDIIEPILEAHRCQLRLEDHRKEYTHVTDALHLVKGHEYTKYTMKDGNPCILRDYQVDAINAALTYSKGLLEMATGSGKTLVCGVLSDLFSRHGYAVVIVPNIDLVIQTQYAFKSIGIDAGVWYGGIKDRKEVTIATWQSLDHYPELFHDVVCVIVDEVHQAKAKILNEMLSGPAANVPFRFGCTGTLPKEKLFQLQIQGVLGETIFKIKSWELQERGVLADTNIYQIKLLDSLNERYQDATIVDVDDGKGGSKEEYEGFEEWREEVDWHFSDPERIDYVSTLLQDIAAHHGNTLVLVSYRKHGKLLQERIPGSVSLDGRDKSRKEFYEEFNAGDNQVLICTYGIASVGIDITRIFNLVFIEPGKKFEKVMQTIGRGLRKGTDKHTLNVYDICSDSGMCRSHASKRRTLYREAKQKFEIIDVGYTNADPFTE